MVSIVLLRLVVECDCSEFFHINICHTIFQTWRCLWRAKGYISGCVCRTNTIKFRPFIGALPCVGSTICRAFVLIYEPFALLVTEKDSTFAAKLIETLLITPQNMDKTFSSQIIPCELYLFKSMKVDAPLSWNIPSRDQYMCPPKETKQEQRETYHRLTLKLPPK